MKDIDELKDYIELEGTEFGEICGYLLDLYTKKYALSDEFYDALSREIEDTLKYFRENCKIIERKETYTREIRELEWFNENN